MFKSKLDHHETHKLNLILLTVVILLGSWSFFGGIQEAFIRWNEQEEYSHGFFIPLLTLWMLWERRAALSSAIDKHCDWYGLILILFSILMLLLGELTALFILIQIGFVCCLCGVLWFYGGRKFLSYAFVPVFYLVFAIPLPYFLESLLTAKLQLFSSDIGVYLLRLLGTTVYQEGNLIDLGDYKLQVIEACSGLRYLYPLMGISFLIAYMYQSSTWKKALIFFSSIPITVLMNSVRIGVIGILVSHWGTEMAEGFLHFFEGWIIFLICLLFLVLQVCLMERLSDRRPLFQAIDLPAIQYNAKQTSEHSVVKKGMLFLIALFISLIAMVQSIDNRVEFVPDRQTLVEYPSEIAGWQGNREYLSPSELETLSLKDYILANYTKDDQHINFYVAYYSSQRKGISPHSPQVCMPGGGWKITKLDRIQLPSVHSSLLLNRVLIENAGRKQLVYYWYQQRGRMIASEYWMKWYLLVDGIFKNRTDGALVRLVVPLSDNETEQAADARIQAFIKVILPTLNAYVPD